MSSLTANKVGALFVFFGTSFLGVWVPYFIPVRQTFLKLGLLFASGLFLSIAFLHLAAECVHVFSEYYVGGMPGPSPPPLPLLRTVVKSNQSFDDMTKCGARSITAVPRPATIRSLALLASPRL